MVATLIAGIISSVAAAGTAVGGAVTAAGGLGAVATGLSAVGTVVGGIQQVNNLRAQKDASNYNAQIADQQRVAAQDQASREEETQRRRARGVLSEQAGSALQSGVGFSGSTLKSFEQSAAEAEYDALNIRYKGLMQANAFGEEAGMFRNKAKQYKGQILPSMIGTGLTAASTFLTPRASNTLTEKKVL